MERMNGNGARSLSSQLNRRASRRRAKARRLKAAGAVIVAVLGICIVGRFGPDIKNILLPDSVLESNEKDTLGNNKQTQGFTEAGGNIADAKYNAVSSLNNSSGTIKERLSRLNNQDSRIKDIIVNYNDYPEELLDMLSRNIDMIDFVIDFPKKKGKVYSDNVGAVKKGQIPLLLQWDERWGYADYGESCIAISGCAPTALAMVIAGLNGDNSVTPYEVGKYAGDNGFYIKGTGTSWNIMTVGSSHFGIKGTEIPLSKNGIYNELQKGHPIICSVRKGDFTTTGHFIVLAGIKDGKIKVNDPNSKQRSEILWDYERLEGQIKNLWAFTKS